MKNGTGHRRGGLAEPGHRQGATASDDAVVDDGPDDLCRDDLCRTVYLERCIRRHNAPSLALVGAVVRRALAGHGTENPSRMLA